MQGKIRSSTEAFLAKKVVVCEGATEVGFVRGFDDHQVGKGKDPLSYHGVELLDARGAKNIKGLAKAFKALGYEVTVLADADSPENFSGADEDELVSLGVPVVTWGNKLSLEERAIQDLPWNAVLASVQLAKSEFAYPVRDQVCSKLVDKIELAQEVQKWAESKNLRTAIGLAAKKCEWFKSISKGDRWFSVIALAYQDPEFATKDLAVKLNELWMWVERV